MGIVKKIKKAIRKPKEYASSKQVGAKAVKTQLRKRQMLKEAGMPPKKRKKGK